MAWEMSRGIKNVFSSTISIAMKPENSHLPSPQFAVAAATKNMRLAEDAWSKRSLSMPGLEWKSIAFGQ
jgi:3-hydroxyisobutyrate dehydrogenase-like beta-hydroxyacid dehydrogenase